MHYKLNYSKKEPNKIMSVRMWNYAKHPITNEPQQDSKTWKVPKTLTTKSEILHELKKVMYEYEQELQLKYDSISTTDSHIMFKDYALRYLENMLINDPDSKNYYAREKDNLKVIVPFFEKYKLNAINKQLIKKFYTYINSRTYIKEKVTIKKSFAELINNNSLSKTKIAQNTGIERHTLYIATKVGEPISKKSATYIAKYFNVPFAQYFNSKKEIVRYSKAGNRSIKTTLVMLFNQAIEDELIDRNPASIKFKITGTEKEKSVYLPDEAQEYVRCALQEKDIRVKTVALLFISLGIRKCELCGYEWKDVDFTNNTISIKRNSNYTAGFGTYTKETKTESSNRDIPLPESLVGILKEYKEWWLEQKQIHGDLWSRTDRLFVQENGKPINPSTIYHWITKFEAINGLKHIPPHSLRHSFVTLGVNAGVPLKVVSQLAGHANEKITLDIYTHIVKDQDRQATAVMDKLLFNY